VKTGNFGDAPPGSLSELGQQILGRQQQTAGKRWENVYLIRLTNHAGGDQHVEKGVCGFIPGTWFWSNFAIICG
jgi:hypothetical protein